MILILHWVNSANFFFSHSDMPHVKIKLVKFNPRQFHGLAISYSVFLSSYCIVLYFVLLVHFIFFPMEVVGTARGSLPHVDPFF